MPQKDGSQTAEERRRLEVLKQAGVDAIWRHTRENRDSLESEKHARLIRVVLDEAVDKSVAFVTSQLDTKTSAMDDLRSQVKNQKQEIKRLQRRVEELIGYEEVETIGKATE